MEEIGQTVEHFVYVWETYQKSAGATGPQHLGVGLDPGCLLSSHHRRWGYHPQLETHCCQPFQTRATTIIRINKLLNSRSTVFVSTQKSISLAKGNTHEGAPWYLSEKERYKFHVKMGSGAQLKGVDLQQNIYPLPPNISDMVTHVVVGGQIWGNNVSRKICPGKLFYNPLQCSTKKFVTFSLAPRKKTQSQLS